MYACMHVKDYVDRQIFMYVYNHTCVTGFHFLSMQKHISCTVPMELRTLILSMLLGIIIYLT